MKTAVIGAGPAGITAAYQLAKAGVTVDVYESSAQVGGLARTIALWGMKADVGPHRFFSKDTRVNKLWLELAQQDYTMINRLTRIYYKGKFFHYPLKPIDALKNLGIEESLKCLSSFAGQKINPVKLNGSFENWVTHRFGKRLYELFFKTYSEKLWGISCAELDDDFAAQRIKKLSLSEAVSNAFSLLKKTGHQSLVDRFAYPNNGTGMIYERMQDYIVKSGNHVFLQSPVQKVVVENNTVKGIETSKGEIIFYDRIISTMPLSQLVTRMDGVPKDIKAFADALKFRNAIMVYLLIEGHDLFPDNWMYIHSADLQTGRITNFRNWSPELYQNSSDTILMLEYWCYTGDEFWEKKDEDLIALAKKEILQTGLIKDKKIKEGFVLRIPKCYPVYEKGYREKLKPVEQYLDTINNLQAIGRFGAFKYNNQDHSILMGMLAAENIILSSKHNLWDINTDYDDYQERSVITEAGLVKG